MTQLQSYDYPLLSSNVVIEMYNNVSNNTMINLLAFIKIQIKFFFSLKLHGNFNTTSYITIY